jgi:hypothetical protein
MDMNPAAAKKVVVYADRENGDRPICLECFVRHKNRAEDPTQKREWSKCEQIAMAAWTGIAEDKRQQHGIDGPEGWVKLMLKGLKWPQVKGRCWGCAAQLALAYRALVEEVEGAPAVKEFADRCRKASEDANQLALEIETCGYRPGVPIFQRDPKYDEMVGLAKAHIISLTAALAKPSAIAAMPLWDYLRSRMAELLPVAEPGKNEVGYDALAVGPKNLRQIAVILKNTAFMEVASHLNFAGVVRRYAKDPHNPPKRLTLVLAYQWAQDLRPPMGYLELAQTLIKYRVIDATPNDKDEAERVADNIKRAVAKYRDLMPIQSWA